MKVYLYMDVFAGQEPHFQATSHPFDVPETGATRYKIGFDIPDFNKPHAEVEAKVVGFTEGIR